MTWDRKPSWSDPRVPFAAILLVYVVLGTTVLGFNRTPLQIATTVAAACLLDMAFYGIANRRLLFPLSACISGLGLAILVNYAHGWWLGLAPVFCAIASKYTFTYNGRHLFNPTLFAVVVCSRLGDGMFSAAPAYQWGGSVAMAAFVVTAALVLFVFRIQRNALILTFLGGYLIQLALRSWITRHHVPPETLFLGAFTSAAFYLFAFFMITDPQTSPSSTRGQVAMGASIVVLDLVLHRFEALSTLFTAGFLYFAGRFLWLHATSLDPWLPRLRGGVLRLASVGGVALAGWGLLHPVYQVAPSFRFTQRPAGLQAEKSDVLDRVDPRIANVAKWVLSAGDAVAVADADGDGRVDVFLTYPLKDASHRAALYLNRAEGFERFPLPELTARFAEPEKNGLPSGALWFDYDNDGDPDLLVLAGYGEPRLLENRREAGSLKFADVTAAAGLSRYTISLGANALDFDRDGNLDLILCDAFNPLLPGYDPPTRFNVFHLPPPAYEGDRRMFNVMHRTWHDANNGGGCRYLHNEGGRFAERDIGLVEHRWSLAVGTGDLNNDGFTDFYIANDFGPDQLYLNDGGRRVILQRGLLTGSISRDTYKGMNASIADFDNNGWQDVYVSNVHERLQAEGSLLWMNRGRARFTDEAVARNALNERRFGWGAAAGDLDKDGRLDIIQANGMVDNSYDPIYPGCPDYWYWNDKIALTNPDNHGYSDRWADLRGRCIFPAETPRVYLNRGSHFVDVAEAAGLAQPGVTRGVALADFENRGQLDAIVTSQFAAATYYRNDAPGNHWIGLDLRGDGLRCNADALGTVVRIGNQMREVQASNGFSAQGDRRLFFGLGDAGGPVMASIFWCGQFSEARKLAPDQYHVIGLGRTSGSPAIQAASRPADRSGGAGGPAASIAKAAPPKSNRIAGGSPVR